MIVPASALTAAELRHVFNLGYSDYLVPLQLDESAFRAHLTLHDVDLDCSTVVVEAGPVAVALVARRGAAAWVAGVGTAPEHRRRGLGEQALTAALRRAVAQGCSVADLEVIDANQSAIALYQKLGFVIVRDLLVWSLPPTERELTGVTPAPHAETQAWIATHGHGRDPWQRSDATVAAILAQGGLIRALMVERDGEPVAGIVWHEQPARAIVLQAAATDESAASRALLAAAGPDQSLAMTNVEPTSPTSLALERLGARRVARQHEMRIELEQLSRSESGTVDFNTVSSVGLESSPVAAALAGLRAHEARYFKNKYDHVFRLEPASRAKPTIDWVHGILKQERDIVISARPLEATAFQVKNIRIAYVFYDSGLSINVMYTIDGPEKRAVGLKLSDGMDVPAELASRFKFARQKSKLAGTIRGSYFAFKHDY